MVGSAEEEVEVAAVTGIAIIECETKEEAGVEVRFPKVLAGLGAREVQV